MKGDRLALNLLSVRLLARAISRISHADTSLHIVKEISIITAGSGISELYSFAKQASR